jgi:hypothetical protein
LKEKAEWTIEDHGDLVIPPVENSDPNVRNNPITSIPSLATHSLDVWALR